MQVGGSNGLDFNLIPIGELAAKAQPIEWVIEGLLASGSILLLTGKAKLGKKSLTALYLSRCIASGEPFLGRPVQRRPVIYSVIEDGEKRMARRAKTMGLIGDAWNGFGPSANQFGALIGIDEHMKFYATLLENPDRLRNFLWIIDPLAQVAAAENADENSASEMTNLMVGYQELAQKTNGSIIMVHHFNKTGVVMRGSSALNAASDGWIESDGNPITEVVRMKWLLRDAKAAEIAAKIAYDKATDRYAITPVDVPSESAKKRKASDRVSAIMATLLEAETADMEDSDDIGAGLTVKAIKLAIQAEFDVAEKTIKRDLEKLMDAGKAFKSGKATWRASLQARSL